MAAQHFINILESMNISLFKKKWHQQQKNNLMTVIGTSAPFDSTFSAEAKMQNWHHEAWNWDFGIALATAFATCQKLFPSGNCQVADS